MPRLKTKYSEQVRPLLMERFGITNVHAAPCLEKVTLNAGVGKAIENSKRLDAAQREMAMIAGQRPVVTRARQAISNFRLRENLGIGCKVTLRGDRMYEFMDRLISVTIPRIRDFRGFSRTAFDGRGNYSMGLSDQIVFPEIKLDDVEFVQGMNICMTVRNSTDEQSLALLTEFGFPFKRD